MADTLGLFFERWIYKLLDENADKSNEITGSWNWTIGEDCGKKMRIMRSFQHPEEVMQPQPSVYKGKYWADPNSPEDYGHVHLLSSVGNKFVYELVQMVGFDVAAKFLFATWKKLQPTSSYMDYRDLLKATAAEFECLPQVLLCLNTVGLTDNAVSDWVPQHQ